VSTLYVVATPIGNLEDLSPRAIRVLREASLIAAEDTRHSRRLLNHFGIATPLLSYHQHNRRERQGQLLQALGRGDVALITDAGTPAVSDPGAELVAAALAGGHRVSPIPGPSALAAAVSASGIVDGPFLSLGFLPREQVKRNTVLAKAAATGWPVVVFEAANRLAKTLNILESAMGDRPAVVLRELTKMHEEARTGTLASLRQWAATESPRGEVVLVVAGDEPEIASQRDAVAVLRVLRSSGLSASQAAREAAAVTGLPRSELYRLATSNDVTASVGLEGELALANKDALQNSLGNEEDPEGG
jgi:16S rRNA (cytidine1402-2'-O)-methyltransferase